MADEIDQAQEQIEKNLAEAIARVHAGPRYHPTGFCHYCDEQVEGKRIFCDKYCEENKAAELRLKAQRKR